MARRRGKGKAGKWVGRVAATILAFPALYLFAALVGALVPINGDWAEPTDGVKVYVVDNGTHADLLMPVRAQGLDWSPLFPARDFADVDPKARLIAFGIGEERVYLETPSWWDLTPRTVWSALSGGQAVMHVEYADTVDPAHSREIRLRPEQYRRLWAAVRADLILDDSHRPERIDHEGYGPADAFYRAKGKQSLIRTCNTRLANWLRLAGVKTSAWTPFVKGLTWRYRHAQRT